jgi:hypothetical protein
VASISVRQLRPDSDIIFAECANNPGFTLFMSTQSMKTLGSTAVATRRGPKKHNERLKEFTAKWVDDVTIEVLDPHDPKFWLRLKDHRANAPDHRANAPDHHDVAESAEGNA